MLFLIVVTSVSAQQAKTEDYRSELFSFSIEKGKRILNGAITLPLNFNQKTPFVVFVSPPPPSDRNYFGLFSYMADVLGRSGIASLRYDNRSYVDSSVLPRDPNKYTMFDNAADLRDAIKGLRKDNRFKQSGIGIIGHSEGGASAAIYASQNKDVSFMIVMSTIGIPGVDLAFCQTVTSNDFFWSQLPASDRNYLAKMLYSTFQIISNELDNNKLRIALADYYKADYLAMSDTEREKMYKKQTVQQAIDVPLKLFMKPRLLEYFRFKPVTYYSKIACPILVTHGKMDETADWKTNGIGLEKIFINSGKKNYTMLFADSLNHNYETAKTGQRNPLFSYSEKLTKKNEWDARFQDVCKKMTDWIHAQQTQQTGN